MGAPYATVVMEELIARGASRFLNIGIAGALQKDLQIGDIVICNRAIRDEGVSHHYLRPGRYVDILPDLTEKLKEELKNQGLRFVEGTTWTTDAPYRETEEEVRQYQNEGVLTVEMETAALASVAKYRDVEFAAAFVISDLLGDLKWESGFGREEVMNGLISLYQAAVLALE